MIFEKRYDRMRLDKGIKPLHGLATLRKLGGSKVGVVGQGCVMFCWCNDRLYVPVDPVVLHNLRIQEASLLGLWSLCFYTLQRYVVRWGVKDAPCSAIVISAIMFELIVCCMGLRMQHCMFP